jgi:hypothetical protein
VLGQFWRQLKRREIDAGASARWRNSQARLLAGPAWAAARDDVLTALGLPAGPGELLAAHAALDAAYREIAARLAVSDAVTIGPGGKIHPTGLTAVEEPPSLAGLRRRTAAMLPRVDLPEVILEVMSWERGRYAAARWAAQALASCSVHTSSGNCRSSSGFPSWPPVSGPR